ncbi:MAG: amidase [Vicinamibacterales bacterium]
MSLADLSATELRRRIAAREVTAVESVEACLERVRQHNPTLNAIVTLNPNALDDAAQLDRRIKKGDDPGPLCGLTVGIKDVTPVAGLRTTFGSPIYADYVPAEDALVVSRLRQAGAVIIGKTNCPEFAAGANTFNEVFGRTRNPWDPTKSAGGSTGGGAAALATGMITLAEGTDLGGSLRIPAAFCGVTGLRPSVGLVPTHPTDWVWDTLQVTGPMARTAEDAALMLQSIAGPAEHSPFAQPIDGRDFVRGARESRKNLRVAYCPDIAGIGVDPDVERVCREAAFSLAGKGAIVEETQLDLSAARPAFLSLRGLWFVTQMFSRLDKQARFGPNVANNVRSGLEVTSREIAAAEEYRARLWHQFRKLFKEYDHLLTPCVAVSPFPVEQNYPDTIAGKPMQTYVDWFAPTFVLSLTGLPVACVPAGLDPSGMPVGLQVAGGQFGEEDVLAVAAQIQKLRPIALP